jgi:hypothetical protein
MRFFPDGPEPVLSGRSRIVVGVVGVVLVAAGAWLLVNPAVTSELLTTIGAGLGLLGVLFGAGAVFGRWPIRASRVELNG